MYDVIVVGLGAMGASCLYQLSKEKGMKVLGLEQFEINNQNGSSHGETRIIRQAIGEGDGYYTAMAQRSYKIIKEIEGSANIKFKRKPGLLLMFNDKLKPKGGKTDFLSRTIQQAKKANIEHAILTKEQLQRQFPFLVDQPQLDNYYEFDAACVCPEECIATQIDLAKSNQANINYNEKVIDIKQYSQDTVLITTDLAQYKAKKVILTVGPWIQEFVAGSKYTQIFKSYIQKIYWFEVDKSYRDIFYKSAPFLIGDPKTQRFVYAMPSFERGLVKFGFEEFEEPFDCTNKSQVTQKDIENIYDKYISPNVKGITNNCIKASACVYTLTPDYDFVIDNLLGNDNVYIISACSGHGFKHSFAIGESLANIVSNKDSAIDLSAFKLSRFNL